ncbi:hypothetical protein VE02_02023 [Pseudogymnoascus sp. 03VT05]|nr:hypothetical protein VE02_02023 [Pseudogymnoascus sp. 03VT05]
MTPNFLTRVIEELGLLSIHRSPIDTKLLCLQRFVRLFAYGGSTLVLALHLSALGISDVRIGLFMTLTLAGDVLISFWLTLVADSLGRKAILALGAVLMTVSGIVFALSGNYWVLLAAAILGVISPSGNEIGPFRAIEESTLAHLTPAANRSDVYAWYSLIGTAGTAFGMITCGWVVHNLQSVRKWDNVRAYRMIFFAYAAVGAIKFCLTCALSRRIEAEKRLPRVVSEPADQETALLLPDGADVEPKAKRSFFALFPDISTESRVIVVNLCVLFALDSFASGLAPLSWVTYFFKRKFDLQEGFLGSLFFVTSIIAAASMLIASSISKRFGNTMVFTHLPSAIALALIPIPSSLPFAVFFLILRSCTQSMDVAPRSAFLAAVVLPNERTAVMGAINVVKTFSQSLGPLITGFLATKGLFWVAFVTAGCLKAAYDLGMLAVFSGHKSREDRDAEEEEAAEQERLRESENPDER